MSTVTSAVTSCPAIQDGLNNYFATCQTVSMGSPMLEFLYSPVNRSGINQLVNPSPNKKKVVTLVYDQPMWVDQASDVTNCDKLCVATTERGDLSKNYEIDCTDGKYIEHKMKTSDWNESCRDNNEVINARLVQMIGGLDDAIAQKTATELGPLTGNYSTDVAAAGLTVDTDQFLEVATLLTGGAINPLAYQQSDLAMKMTNFCNGEFHTGGSQWYQYYRLMQAGCCADQGVDASEMLSLYGRAVTWDRWVAAAFGDDVSLVFQPRSVQLLTYNDTDPRVSFDGGLVDLDMTYRNFFEAVIVSPRTGIPYDFTMKNDCGVIHMVLKGTTKAVGLPIDMYPTGHPLEGVTYLNGIVVSNP